MSSVNSHQSLNDATDIATIPWCIQILNPTLNHVCILFCNIVLRVHLLQVLGGFGSNQCTNGDIFRVRWYHSIYLFPSYSVIHPICGCYKCQRLWHGCLGPICNWILGVYVYFGEKWLWLGITLVTNMMVSLLQANSNMVALSIELFGQVASDTRICWQMVYMMEVSMVIQMHVWVLRANFYE